MRYSWTHKETRLVTLTKCRRRETSAARPNIERAAIPSIRSEPSRNTLYHGDLLWFLPPQCGGRYCGGAASAIYNSVRNKTAGRQRGNASARHAIAAPAARSLRAGRGVRRLVDGRRRRTTPRRRRTIGSIASRRSPPKRIKRSIAASRATNPARCPLPHGNREEEKPPCENSISRKPQVGRWRPSQRGGPQPGRLQLRAGPILPPAAQGRGCGR